MSTGDRYVSPGLSAGRVQSCGLDIIAERERARWAFMPSKYYSIETTLAPKGNASTTVDARLISVGGNRVATNGDFDGDTGELKVTKKTAPTVLDGASAEGLLRWLSGFEGERPALSITDKTHKKVSRRAPVPFITSTLQQDGSRALGLSPARTMSIAQELYELGYITYMRTDSPLLSTVARAASVDHVSESFGPEYVMGQKSGAKVGRTKDAPKNAQEAHEAIRPAIVDGHFRPPYATELSGQKLQLYSLIYKRTLASVMSSSESLTTTYTITAQGGGGSVVERAELRAAGTKVIFPGFLRAVRMPLDRFYETVPFDYAQGLPDMPTGQEMFLQSGPVGGIEALAVVEGDEGGEEDGDAGEIDDAGFGDCGSSDEQEGLEEGQQQGLRALEHVTRAPSRFSEASFIKELEAMGVGRPSTYAKILQILRDREYVKVESRTVVPSLTGMVVSSLMRRHFQNLVEPSFTAGMEAQLDAIAAGTTNKEAFLKEFYTGGADTGAGMGGGLRQRVTEKLDLNEIDHRDSRALVIPALRDLGTIFVGRSGAFIERVIGGQEGEDEPKSQRWKLPELMQQDIRAITPEAIVELLATGLTTEGALVGRCPETDRPVSVRSGRFGKYLLIGEDSDKTKRTFSVPESLSPEAPLDVIMQYTRLPLEMGMHPALNLPMIVEVSSKALAVGVQGYPVRVVLPDDNMHPMDVTAELAAQLLEDGQAILDSQRALGEWLREGEEEPREVSIRRGRFGPYLRAGNVIAGLRKVEPADLTLEMAIDILTARGKEAGGRKGKKSAGKAKAKAKVKKAGSPRAKTSYQFFAGAALKGELDSGDGTKVKLGMKEAAAHWKAMSEADKEPFARKAAESKAEVGALRASNSTGTSTSTRTSPALAPGTPKIKKKKIATRRRKTAYMFFVSAAMKGGLSTGPSTGSENGAKAPKMGMAEAAMAWKSLPESDKAPFVAMAAASAPPTKAAEPKGKSRGETGIRCS